VLGDLVQRPAPDDAVVPAGLAELVALELPDDQTEQRRVCRTGVVTLTEVHRSKRRVTELAAAIRTGDADLVVDLLRAGGDVGLVAPDDLSGVHADVVSYGNALTDAAEAGDASGALRALESHRLLCAHRQGPAGVGHWSRQVEEWLRAARPGYGRDGLWYVGRPLLVTANDRDLGLYNGDTGVVVDDGRRRAAFVRAGAVTTFPTSRLSDVTTVHAMSVHKSQGSEFTSVTVVLPGPDSPLLTKELFYTAVTRAKERVRVVGTEEAVRTAVARRIQRASGLATPT
jgi:exodeoxyribonuclease V alpha subunit